MILRLIIKKDCKFITKDIQFYWNQANDARIYRTDNIPESEIKELLSDEVVGVEVLPESSDF